MTANQFRKLALSLPEAVEASHMNHPDFRVGGKIFATIGPEDDWAMVKLTQAQQAHYMAEAEAFSPASGAWGRNGATIIQLRPARVPLVRQALTDAWNNTAPPRLRDAIE